MSQDKPTKSPKSLERKPLTAERLREFLHYDPETGGWRWLVQRGCVKVGNVPICRNRAGYTVIRIDKRLYRSCRLAALYMTGEWPPDEIDHEDKDQANDRWLNLRFATRILNMGNTKRRSHNKSGFKGVCWDKHLKKWRAEICKNYKNQFLGHFKTPEEAHTAYCKAAVERYGEFASFD